MSDGDYQREDITYLSFEFNGELIEPEQYLQWLDLEEEYLLNEKFREYAKEI